LYGLPQSAIGILRIIPANNNDEEDHVDVMHCGNELVGCHQKFVSGQNHKNNGSIYGLPFLPRSGVLKISTAPNNT